MTICYCWRQTVGFPPQRWSGMMKGSLHTKHVRSSLHCLSHNKSLSWWETVMRRKEWTPAWLAPLALAPSTLYLKLKFLKARGCLQGLNRFLSTFSPLLHGQRFSAFSYCSHLCLNISEKCLLLEMWLLHLDVICSGILWPFTSIYMANLWSFILQISVVSVWNKMAI